VKPPVPDWDGYKADSESNPEIAGEEHGGAEMRAAVIDGVKSDVLFMPVTGDRFGNSTRVVRRLHVLLKNASPTLPKAVFMGGRPAETLLAVFKRPLMAEDFGRLWFAQPTA
jgi:hypothetical protein